MVTAAGSAPVGVFVFIKAMLTVLVEAMVPVIIVFVKTALTVLIEVMVPAIIVFVKVALTVLIEAMVPVIIVFVKAMLAVLFQVLPFLSAMVTEGRGILSVSAAFIGVTCFPGTGDRIFLFFLQGLMNDRAPGVFRID
jgi:hypothetical protein